MTRSIPAIMVGSIFLVVAAGACSSNDENQGSVLVSWTLQDAQGTEVGCKSDEIIRVTVNQTSEDFPCPQGSAETFTMPSGSFTATFELVDTNGAESTVAFPVTIRDGMTTDAGHVVFTVPQ